MIFYLRIFPTRSFRIACFVVMAIVVSWSLGAIFATIFQCIPIAASWNKEISGNCVNSDATWFSYAVINILTDVIVLALPIPLVLRLHLSLRNRLLLCGIFLLGCLYVQSRSFIPLISCPPLLIISVQRHGFFHHPRHVCLQLTQECVGRDIQFCHSRHVDDG